jgi:hypothetical protein
LGSSKGLEEEFWQELQAYEEERKVPYITSVERIGYDRGKVEGKGEEAQILLVRLLTRKFGSVNDSILAKVQNLEIKQLESLGEDLLDFESIDDLTAWLEHQG